MRLIGSGKVDESGKILLDKAMMRILGVKPGEEVVFAKDAGAGIRVVKDTGTGLSTEADDLGLSLKAAGAMIRGDLVITAVALCATLVGSSIAICTGGTVHLGASIVALVGFLISFISIYRVWIDLREMDQDSVPGAFVPKAGLLSNGRVIGVTKIMSDTEVASCSAFMYPLFGSSPSRFSATLRSKDGSTESVTVDVKGEKAGVSEYEMKFAVSPAFRDCVLEINAAYVYRQKAIIMDAEYDVSFNDDFTMVDMRQKKADFKLTFDEKIQKPELSTGLYDRSGDGSN